LILPEERKELGRSRIRGVAIATAQAKGAFFPSSQALSLFFPSQYTTGFGSASYLLPHLILTLTLTLFLLFLFFLLSSFSSPPTHTINPHHSTICFLHSLALTVGSLISIQSSRQITLVTLSAPTPPFVLQLPASNQPYSSGFVQVCLPHPVLSWKALPKGAGICTALDTYITVDHDADFDVFRLPISPTHTALDLPHSNSQHQR
jgi:hypothetical protein